MDAELVQVMRDWPSELGAFEVSRNGSLLGRIFEARGIKDSRYQEFETGKGKVGFVCSASNCWNGFAVIRYEDGSFYAGELKAGLREGQGVRTHSKSTMVYSGQFVKGKKEGEGRLIDSRNGKVAFEGTWKGGVKEGQGVLLYSLATYKGNFSEDLFHGQGKLSWRNGDVYQGEFVKGRPSGKGNMRFANGDFYEGEFCDGVAHGEGSYLWNNGEVYVGKFDFGKLEGKGSLQFSRDVKGEGVFDPEGRNVRYELIDPPMSV